MKEQINSIIDDLEALSYRGDWLLSGIALWGVKVVLERHLLPAKECIHKRQFIGGDWSGKYWSSEQCKICKETKNITWSYNKAPTKEKSRDRYGYYYWAAWIWRNH